MVWKNGDVDRTCKQGLEGCSRGVIETAIYFLQLMSSMVFSVIVAVAFYFEFLVAIKNRNRIV